MSPTTNRKPKTTLTAAQRRALALLSDGQEKRAYALDGAATALVRMGLAFVARKTGRTMGSRRLVITSAGRAALAEAKGIAEEAVPTGIEPDCEPPYEHCCFCDKVTRHWTTIPERKPGEQVACCEVCAKTHKVAEVPSKADWFKAEAIRHPSLNRKFIIG